MATDDRAIFRNRGERIGQGLRTATDFAGRVLQQSHDTGAAARQGIRDIVMAPINAAGQFGQGVRSGLGLPPSAGVTKPVEYAQRGASRSWGEPTVVPASTVAEAQPAATTVSQPPSIRNAATAAPASMSTSVVRGDQPAQNYDFTLGGSSGFPMRTSQGGQYNFATEADLKNIPRGQVAWTDENTYVDADGTYHRTDGNQIYKGGKTWQAEQTPAGVVFRDLRSGAVFNSALEAERGNPVDVLQGDAKATALTADAGLRNAQARAIPEELAISRQGLGLRQAALSAQRNALPEQVAGNVADRFVDIYGTQLNPTTSENEQTRRTAYIDESGNLQYVGGGGPGSDGIERLRAIGRQRGYKEDKIDKLISERIFGE